MVMEKGVEKRDIEHLNIDRLPKSSKILERAKKVLLSPTVTGPFRAPKAVAFIKEAKGSKIIDEDGNDHINGMADRIKREVHKFAEENEFEVRLLGLGSWFIPYFLP